MPSQTALRMKRQINCLSTYLNYFAVLHSFLRSTFHPQCRMEYGLQRKETMDYNEGRTTLTAEFVNNQNNTALEGNSGGHLLVDSQILKMFVYPLLRLLLQQCHTTPMPFNPLVSE